MISDGNTDKKSRITSEKLSLLPQNLAVLVMEITLDNSQSSLLDVWMFLCADAADLRVKIIIIIIITINLSKVSRQKENS